MKVGVIGNGKMAMDCMRQILKKESFELNFLIFDPAIDPAMNSIAVFAEKNNISSLGTAKINSKQTLTFIEDKKPDLIFNINSYKIIKNELLKLPQKGIINFHNGPLPKYGGVNIPSWVIINGEKQHGVTWHYMDEGIDSGAIIAQNHFALEKDETAATLMVKCIQQGINLFKEILELLKANNIQTPQQKKGGSYYSLRDFPENNGVLDFTWPFAKIDRYVRGLNYIPFENNFTFAKMENNAKFVVVNEIEIAGERKMNIQPGQVVQSNKNKLHIACQDKIVSIVNMMTTDFDELTCKQAAEHLELKENHIIN